MELKDVDNIFYKVRGMIVDKVYTIDEHQASIIKEWWKLIHIDIDGYCLTFSSDFKKIWKSKMPLDQPQ